MGRHETKRRRLPECDLSARVSVMATKRPGRVGIFQGTPRTPSKRPGARSLPAAHSGAVYTWDTLSDALTWSPNAAALLGISARDLPRTGRAFSQLVEPGSGVDRRAAMEDQPHPSFETRYAL